VDVADIGGTIFSKKAVLAFFAAVAHSTAIDPRFVLIELAVEARGGGWRHGGGRSGKRGGFGADVVDAIATATIVRVGAGTASSAAVACTTAINIGLSAVELLVDAV
jgi:hypothetical protein